MIRRPLRVVKLGGSLFRAPHLSDAFDGWLRKQPAMVTLVVAGGGPLADVMRRAERIHQLDPVAVHWLSIRAMRVSAALVARAIRNTQLCERLEEVGVGHDVVGAREATTWVLDPWHFLWHEDRCSARPLPCTSDVTSDSIAACIAARLGAEELVLLKSTLPEPVQSLSAGATIDAQGMTWSAEALAACGYVDPFFPRAVGSDGARCVNLRDPRYAEIVVSAGAASRHAG